MVVVGHDAPGEDGQTVAPLDLVDQAMEGLGLAVEPEWRLAPPDAVVHVVDEPLDEDPRTSRHHSAPRVIQPQIRNCVPGTSNRYAAPQDPSAPCVRDDESAQAVLGTYAPTAQDITRPSRRSSADCWRSTAPSVGWPRAPHAHNPPALGSPTASASPPQSPTASTGPTQTYAATHPPTSESDPLRQPPPSRRPTRTTGYADPPKSKPHTSLFRPVLRSLITSLLS
jgi:hypothetical protein